MNDVEGGEVMNWIRKIRDKMRAKDFECRTSNDEFISLLELAEESEEIDIELLAEVIDNDEGVVLTFD